MIASTMTLVMALTAGASDAGFDAAFERLKSLVGTWQIVGESGGEVTYFLTGGDAALVERFDRMSSVYHMDGSDLRVTHYCGARNQPRMKAASYDSEKGLLRFDFVDVTNLSAPDAYYTREIQFRFLDADNVEVRFSGLEKGEEKPATVRLRRK
jgi:hypothetical protein